MSIRYLLGILLIQFLAGCSHRPESPPDDLEVQSLTSPDGLVRAYVLMPEQSGALGATVSQTYQVWLQSLRPAKDQELVLEAGKIDGLHVSWTSEGRLQVCYEDAQITSFWNQYVIVDNESLQARTIESVLKRAKNAGDCDA